MSDDPPQSIATSLPSTESQDTPPNLIKPGVECQPSSFGIVPVCTNPSDVEGVGPDSIDILEPEKINTLKSFFQGYLTLYPRAKILPKDYGMHCMPLLLIEPCLSLMAWMKFQIVCMKA